MTDTKIIFRFVYVMKGELSRPKKEEIDNTLLALRDDVIGYLEGKRPFPAYLKVEVKEGVVE